MKNILKYITLLLAFVVIFASCKDDEKPFLTVDETPIFATAEGGTYTIAVSSNGEWAAVVEDAEDHAWLTLTNATGRNDGTITVDVSENMDTLPRSATVKISLGDLTKSVVINQDAGTITPIVGKWELIEFIVDLPPYDSVWGHYTPTRYIEFLPNGRYGWYDYATEKFTFSEMKYRFYKEIYTCDGSTYERWVLDFEDCYLCEDYVYFIDSDTYYTILHGTTSNYRAIHKRIK